MRWNCFSNKTIWFQFLLTNERVDEALELSEMVASRAVNSHESDEKDLDSIVNFVRSRAAFISLKKMELRRAQELFIRGRVDPREIISLFPRMLPASSNFTRTVPALHDIADINQVRQTFARKLLTSFCWKLSYPLLFHRSREQRKQSWEMQWSWTKMEM